VGLKELAGLQQLQSLGLRGTQVTGTALKHLAGLKQLLSLDLSNTKVTETDVALKELRKALPNCNIYAAPRVDLDR
jgi:internalin A